MRVNSFVFQNSDMSKEQAESVWGGLRKGITEIQNGNASQLRFEELYRNSYTLVLHKHGDLLYDGVSKTIKTKLYEVSNVVAGVANAQLVETIVEEWDHHKLIMTMIRDILMYMDKTYCEIKKRVPVYDLGFTMFRDVVAKNKGVCARLRDELLMAINQERNNQVIDHMLMKNCLRMLVDCNVTSHQVYQEEFENHFIKTTETFYRTESQNFISQNNCPDYLKKVEQRLTQEEERANLYLDPKTKPRLLTVCEKELITRFAEQLVQNKDSGCIPMFDKNMIEDLARMYRLFSRTDSLNHISDCLESYVKDLGTKIVTDPENRKNPRKFVQEVLDLRRKYHNIVSVAFEKNRNFERHLKEAFEHFINLDMRAAQYLSLYIDEMMKKGLRGVSEEEIEDKLKNVVTIFRYLSDKDIFEDFYKQHLAARLLMGKRISDDIEKSMIAMLKAECGHQFTSKLEGMFKDMDLSKEMSESYRSWNIAQRRRVYDSETLLSTSVLTTGFWPFPDVPECNLPKVILDRCKHFKAFYINLHSGRRLKWNTSLGNAELLCQFDSGKKELLVHTYQMCILMMFNENNTYTVQQMQEQTNIPKEELERHLLSLAHPKIRVLVKQPNTKQIAPDHTFTYNQKYKNKLYRVKIPLLAPKGKDVPESKDKVPDGVMEARKNRVEASIVRIMKARRTLNHNNLISEVCKHLSSRFVSEPSFIKKRIESLIEREYLERDKDDRRTYHYLA